MNINISLFLIFGFLTSHCYLIAMADPALVAKYHKLIHDKKNLYDQMIRTLNIGAQGLQDDDAIAIAEILSNDNELQSLSLPRNKISDKGAKALAKAIEGHDNLKYLDLSDNLIGNEGALAFAVAIQKNNTLVDLNLSNNEFTDNAAKAIADALKLNYSLKHVQIKSIKIDNLSILFDVFTELNKNKEIGDRLKSNLKLWETAKLMIKAPYDQKSTLLLKPEEIMKQVLLFLIKLNVKDKGFAL